MNPWRLFSVFMSGMGILISLCISGVFVVFIAVMGVLFYRYNQKSKAERQAAQSWPNTTGTILSSNVQWRRGPDHRDEQVAVVTYQYEVNGKMHEGQTVKAGEQFLRVRMPGDNQAIVARYPTGATVTVYYNPSDPSDAALER